jgi:hypothetical protein
VACRRPPQVWGVPGQSSDLTWGELKARWPALAHKGELELQVGGGGVLLEAC